MFKKISIILFVILSILLSAILLIPVFFDADKHLKPYIEKTISQYLDVDAKIGHLSVSLWGKIKVEVKGIDLIDRLTSQSVFKVGEAAVEAPVAPIFDNVLDISLIAKNPQIKVIAEKDGRLNWTRLMRQSAGGSETKTSPTGASKPELLNKFKMTFSLQIDDAVINYKDVVKKSETILKDFDFMLTDFSFDRPFEYKITSRLNSQQAATKLSGPAELKGKVHFLTENTAIKGLYTTGKINLDQLDIRSSSFAKPAGVPLNFNLIASILEKSAKLTVDSNIESVRLNSRLLISKYSPLEMGVDLSATKIDLQQLTKINAQIADLTAKFHVTPDTIDITQSRFKIFKGDYSGTGKVGLSPKLTKVVLKGRISGIDIDEAIVSQMPDLKDTLRGRLSSEYSVATFGADSDDYKKNLSGSGAFNIKDGSWSALYGLKMLGEKLSVIPGMKEKVGELKVGDKIETAKSNFKIANQKIALSDTLIELKDSHASIAGSGDIGFNKQMHFKGLLIASLGEPPPALRNPDGRAKLPFEFSGAFNGPIINWNITTDAVAKAYLRQEGEKLLNQVKDQIKDENLKKILEKAPEGLDKLLKDIKL